jgi:hypothetical protein
MASKAKSAKSKPKAKKAAKKPARGKPVKKAAKKAAKNPAKKPAKKAPAGNKGEGKNVKTVAKTRTAKKDTAQTTGKKPSMTEAKPAKNKKEKVAAGVAASEPAPGKARATGVAEEPQDVDEYESQRLAAVEPFKRSGAAPKPGAAGRLFDDEAELEDYDPLFDEVEEEDE